MLKDQEQQVSEDEEFIESEAVSHGVAPAENDLEIEVVDDTPENDRGRKPSKEPVQNPEDDDDELDSYGEKVQKRIRHLNRRYHDERRVKEAIQREHDELTNHARRIQEENKALKRQLASGSEVFIAKSVSEAEALLAAAKREVREAHENGDSDKLVDAQEKLARAVASLEEAKRLKPLTVESEEAYIPHTETSHQQTVEPPSESALAWADRNRWFGENERMTAMAYVIHGELVKDGVELDTPEYYEKIDAGMREVFPQYFDAERTKYGRDNQPRTRPNSVVAPASRSTAPGKIRLTKTQVAIAKRLGVPLEEYARQVKLLENR